MADSQKPPEGKPGTTARESQRGQKPAGQERRPGLDSRRPNKPERRGEGGQKEKIGGRVMSLRERTERAHEDYLAAVKKVEGAKQESGAQTGVGLANVRRLQEEAAAKGVAYQTTHWLWLDATKEEEEKRIKRTGKDFTPLPSGEDAYLSSIALEGKRRVADNVTAEKLLVDLKVDEGRLNKQLADVRAGEYYQSLLADWRRVRDGVDDEYKTVEEWRAALMENSKKTLSETRTAEAGAAAAEREILLFDLGLLDPKEIKLWPADTLVGQKPALEKEPKTISPEVLSARERLVDFVRAEIDRREDRGADLAKENTAEFAYAVAVLFKKENPNDAEILGGVDRLEKMVKNVFKVAAAEHQLAKERPQATGDLQELMLESWERLGVKPEEDPAEFQVYINGLVKNKHPRLFEVLGGETGVGVLVKKFLDEHIITAPRAKKAEAESVKLEVSKEKEISPLERAMDKAAAVLGRGEKVSKEETPVPVNTPAEPLSNGTRHTERAANWRAARMAGSQSGPWAPGRPDLTRAQSLSQAAANITLGLVGSADELHPGTETRDPAEFDNKFTEATRRLWKDLITIHGKNRTESGKGKEKVKTEKETEEVAVVVETDFDGRAVLGLLKLAGIDTDGVHCVLPGTAEAGRINIDTSNNDGIGQATLPDGGTYFFIDHHGSKSDAKTSAAAHLLHAFRGLGLLPPKEWQMQAGDSEAVKAEKEKKIKVLLEVVDFVTITDNLGYSEQGKLFSQSDKTLVGLRFRNEVTFEKMQEIIAAGKKPIDVLSEEELQKFGLADASKKHRKNIIEPSLQYLDFLQESKQIYESSIYGKVVVDVRAGKDMKLRGGADAAASLEGAGAFVIWDPREKSFVIYTLGKPLARDFSLPNGKKIREGMWMYPVRGEENKPLVLGPGKILFALGCSEKEIRDKMFPESEIRKRWEKFKNDHLKTTRPDSAVEAPKVPVLPQPPENLPVAPMVEAPPLKRDAIDADPEDVQTLPPPPPLDDTGASLPKVEKPESATLSPIIEADRERWDAQSAARRELRDELQKRMFDNLAIGTRTLEDYWPLYSYKFREQSQLVGGEEAVKAEAMKMWEELRHNPDYLNKNLERYFNQKWVKWESASASAALVGESFDNEAIELLGGEEAIKRKAGEFWGAKQRERRSAPAEFSPVSSASLRVEAPSAPAVPELKPVSPPEPLYREAPVAPASTEIRPAAREPERPRLETREELIEALNDLIYDVFANFSHTAENLDDLPERYQTVDFINFVNDYLSTKPQLLQSFDQADKSGEWMEEDVNRYIEVTLIGLVRDEFTAYLDIFVREKKGPIADLQTFENNFAAWMQELNPAFVHLVRGLRQEKVFDPQRLIKEGYEAAREVAPALERERRSSTSVDSNRPSVGVPARGTKTEPRMKVNLLPASMKKRPGFFKRLLG